MDWITVIANWFAENEAALSGLVAFVALIGLVLSPLGSGFRALFSGRDGKSEQAAAPIAPVSRSGKPAIYIEAFTGSSDEARKLAAELDEEVRRAVANFTGSILVVDITLADYIARANVMLSDVRCRVTLRLQDAQGDEEFWSARFDADIDDQLEAIDQLSPKLSTAIRFEVNKHFGAHKGNDFETKLANLAVAFMGVDEKAWAETPNIATELLAEQPEHSMLQGLYGQSLRIDFFLGYQSIEPEQVAKIERAISKSVSLNRGSEIAHAWMGMFLLYDRLDHREARRSLDHCLKINPSHFLGQSSLGQLEVYCENTRTGIERCEKVLEYLHAGSISVMNLQAIAAGELKLDNYDTATEWAERALHQFGNITPTLIVLAAAAGLAGNEEVAHRTIESLKEKHPEISIDTMRRWPYKDDADWESFVSGLRKAGLE